MSTLNRLIHSLWLGLAYNDYRCFKSHLVEAHRIQERRLMDSIRKNASTAFGKEHRFSSIDDIPSFKRSVPIREYDDYAPWLERAIHGEEQVLTLERILLFQPTGGTSSGSKLIPYTLSLRREFQRGINPWIFDLYRNFPSMLRGRAYWSISPKVEEKKYTKDGIPIGFEEDTEYLGRMGEFLERVFVVPSETKRIRSVDNLRYVTLYFLLLAEDLALISVWNPSFLTLLLEDLVRHTEDLLRDIHEGRLRLPVEEDLHFLKRFLSPSPARAKELGSLLHLHASQRYAQIWPELKLISCWKEGPSNHHAKGIARTFPEVRIQGKGLVATEGFISFPLFEAKGNVPAYTSHFLEFLGEGEETTRLLGELEEGRTYTVILTTGGGLYRYNLKDRIKITGRHKGMPLIRFLGRESVSDLVGEKLEETHVQRVVQTTLEKHGIEIEFILVSPQIEERGGHYVLFLEVKKEAEKGLFAKISTEIDQGLGSNFHYRHARDLKQILPFRVFLIAKNGSQSYFRRCVEDGQRMGEIKHVLLDKRTGWADYFAGELI